jgi:hypothetical protein
VTSDSCHLIAVTRSRERNVGWRLDYFFVSPDLRDCIVDAGIHDDVMGTDHCPISLTWIRSRSGNPFCRRCPSRLARQAQHRLQAALHVGFSRRPR